MKEEVLTDGTDDYNSMSQPYMLFVFVTKATFKGLTWKKIVWCLCMCFVLYWCMDWFRRFYFPKSFIREEFWTVNLLMAEFDHPEVSQSSWRDFQSITTYLQELSIPMAHVVHVNSKWFLSVWESPHGLHHISAVSPISHLQLFQC